MSHGVYCPECKTEFLATKDTKVTFPNTGICPSCRLKKRLEAAEKVCEVVSQYTIADNRDGLFRLLEEWRRLSGEGK